MREYFLREVLSILTPKFNGNFCHAPVLVAAAAGAVHYQPSFYYIAHFRRFVRPGARLAALANESGVAAIAFVNPDSSVVVIVVNASDDAAAFTLAVADDARSCRVPAHAIQTYVVAR